MNWFSKLLILIIIILFYMFNKYYNLYGEVYRKLEDFKKYISNIKKYKEKFSNKDLLLPTQHNIISNSKKNIFKSQPSKTVTKNRPKIKKKGKKGKNTIPMKYSKFRGDKIISNIPFIGDVINKEDIENFENFENKFTKEKYREKNLYKPYSVIYEYDPEIEKKSIYNINRIKSIYEKKNELGRYYNNLLDNQNNEVN